MGLFTNDDKSAAGSSEITIISEHLSITGEITGPDNVYINGTFKGRIVTQGEVSIGPKGKVDAEIITKSLLVSGYLEGTIECEAITIFPTGKVIGNMCSSTLEMHPGGYYFGESTLRSVKPAPTENANGNKTNHLSVVAASPFPPKESGSASAFASKSPKKGAHAKGTQVARDDSSAVAALKPATSRAQETERTLETIDTEQSVAPIPNETAEPRRWHSSWGRR